MKYLKYIFITSVISIIYTSCSKESNSVKPVPISAVTIVNAVINSNPLIADLSGADSVAAYFSTTPQIGFGAFQEYSIPSGIVPGVVYQTSDTTHPLFSNKLNLQPQGIYSLFLSGV